MHVTYHSFCINVVHARSKWMPANAHDSRPTPSRTSIDSVRSVISVDEEDNVVAGHVKAHAPQRKSSDLIRSLILVDEGEITLAGLLKERFVARTSAESVQPVDSVDNDEDIFMTACLERRSIMLATPEEPPHSSALLSSWKSSSSCSNLALARAAANHEHRGNAALSSPAAALRSWALPLVPETTLSSLLGGALHHNFDIRLFGARGEYAYGLVVLLALRSLMHYSTPALHNSCNLLIDARCRLLNCWSPPHARRFSDQLSANRQASSA